MVFHTYVSKAGLLDIHSVVQFLLGEVQQADIKIPGRKEALIRALENSGGSSIGSRYGLNGEITFADTELISACEYDGNPVHYLNYRYEFKYYPSNHILKEFPLVIAVEASAKCNLRCRMCFQQHMDAVGSKQNQTVMSWETYEKFIGELKENQLYSIVFASRGEPLLNPNIDRMIRVAKEHGVIDIKLNTNAVLLTEECSRKLLSSGLDLIVFSVDSVSPDVYRNIRGTNLEVVLRNIKRFEEIRRTEFPSSKTKTRVAMVITKNGGNHTEEEINKAREYWKDRVDELSIKTENEFIHIYDDGAICSALRECSLLWERMYLWADGSLNPCDIDHLSTMCMGNIMQGNSIRSVWQGEQMNTLREHHLNSRTSMNCVCKNCMGY